MPVFPSYGQMALEGYSENPESGVDRTSIPQSLANQRKKNTLTQIPRPVTMVFSGSEYSSFKIWFNDEIGGGLFWFDWIDPLDGNTKQARFFNASYLSKSFSRATGDFISWEVNFTLETLA